MGELVLAVDTSGSIDVDLLQRFGAELRAAVDQTAPSRVRVIYCDTKVHRVDTFERGEEITLAPVGGGGTDFRPVFDAIEERPACLVFFTDLCGRFPETAPDYPVLWAVAQRDAKGHFPWGDLAVVD